MQLIDSINDVYDAYQTGDKTTITEAYHKMVDITVNHFANEEAMLAANNYRALEAHKQVHTNFVNRLQDLLSRYDNGDEAAMQEALNILEGWLFRHIKVNDGG